MAAAKATTDHELIKQWVEDHGGKPAGVRGTGGQADPGILRIELPGDGPDESLQPISWDEFFEAFEENELAFLFQADNPESRFNKFVKRENITREQWVDSKTHGRKGSSRAA